MVLIARVYAEKHEFQVKILIASNDCWLKGKHTRTLTHFALCLEKIIFDLNIARIAAD